MSLRFAVVSLAAAFSIMWGSGLNAFVPVQEGITGFARCFLFLCPPLFMWFLVAAVYRFLPKTSEPSKEGS